MNTLQILNILQILISLGLVIVILLQSRGSGLGTTFGGSGGGDSFRSKRGVEKLLFNLTIVLGIGFALNAIAIFYFYSKV